MNRLIYSYYLLRFRLLTYLEDRAAAFLRSRDYLVVRYEGFHESVMNSARRGTLSQETWRDLEQAQRDPEAGEKFREILGTSR